MGPSYSDNNFGDATINRHDLRLGTSEIHDMVEKFPRSSMLIEVDQTERAGVMMMFVVLREGLVLDAERQAAIEDAIPAPSPAKNRRRRLNGFSPASWRLA